MARSRSLVQLRSDVRRQADIVNATTRHPDSELTRWINESIQELRELVSENGHDYYLRVDRDDLVAGDFAITMPTDFLRVKAIDIEVNGESIELEEFQLSERNNYGGSLVTAPERGTPVAFRMIEPVTAVGLVAPVQALLMPISDGAYPYWVWYLPVWQDLAADGDLFDGIADWERWVVWDVCVKIAVEDKNATLFQMAQAERAKKEGIIKAKRHKRAAAPARRLDTRAMRRETRMRRDPPWWT